MLTASVFRELQVSVTVGKQNDDAKGFRWLNSPSKVALRPIILKQLLGARELLSSRVRAT